MVLFPTYHALASMGDVTKDPRAMAPVTVMLAGKE